LIEFGFSSLRFPSRGLWGSSRVEQLFRQAKAVLATRPIYHSCDMAIRGHVFCSFLALLLVKELEDRLHRHNIAAEWDDILRDLDRLQEIELEQDGKRFPAAHPDHRRRW
jgi:hypothetical protein